MSSYRYLPLGTADEPVVQPDRYTRKVWVFWTFGVLFAVGLLFVPPLGFILSIPFLIGYATKRPRRPAPPVVYDDAPYDNL